MAAEKTLRIEVPGAGAITAIRTNPRSVAAGGDAGWTFVYAPGASADVSDPFGVHTAKALAERGVTTVRFQFPYKEAKKSAPDRPPVLEATWAAVIDAVRPAGGKLCIGGRSMGGRIGSMVHAAGVKVDALALFAYPLHPPGKPQQLRTEHLPAIKARTLFVSGTRDAFGSPEEMRAAAALVKRSKVHMLEGADHGFSVPKSSGRTKVDVWDEAIGALVSFLKV